MLSRASMSRRCGSRSERGRRLGRSAMYVGIARFVLQIPGARSLKDRRSVVKSCKERMRARLPVSAAEVGDVEAWQVATIGITTVARERARCEEVIEAATSLAGSLPEALLADVRREVVSLGSGGSRIQGGIETLLDDDRRAREMEEGS